MTVDAFAAQPVTAEEFEAYSSQVRDFQASAVRSANRSKRVAWALAGVGVVVGLAGLGTAAALAPLKTVELRTIVVDRATGSAEVLRTLAQPPETVDEAHVKHMAWQYILAREGYSSDTDADDFRVVNLMSTAEEQAAYSRWFYSVEGPRKELGTGGTAKIKVASLQVFAGADGTAERVVVRFSRDLRRAGPGRPAETQFWVVTIRFGWSRSAIRAEDRLVNPFGWLVTDYRRDPETPR